MQITDNKKLKDIQQEFSDKFPYLKLEFYKGKHESGQPSPAGRQLDPEKTIGQVRTARTEGDMSIDGHLKVNTLEDRFWRQYGLNVQVFRLSGNLWLQTSTHYRKVATSQVHERLMNEIPDRTEYCREIKQHTVKYRRIFY